MVVNGTSVTGYVNGAQDSGLSRTLGANIVYKSASSNHIGVRSGGFGSYGWWNGRVDEVRVYSDTLTATEIGYIYNNTTASIPTNNLLAHYKLNGDARDEQQLYDGTASNVTYAYDGTATNITYQEATKFQPDLVWIKSRDNTRNHRILDSIRGTNKELYPNLTNAEGTFAALSSFDSNGFTLSTSDANYNAIGEDYVAWCWKAGGTKVANTDGNNTGTVNVSANADAGFSMVEFTSESGSGKTAGHGLGVAPKLVIFKVRNLSGRSWWTFTTVIDGSHDYLVLNGTAAKVDAAEAAPTDSVITQPTTASGRNYIAYCFADVAGYQKIDKYTGNGSANGPIIETGFEPAFVMIKNTDGSDSWDRWYISDNKRLTDGYLYANENLAEQSYQAIKMLSNGFEVITNDTGVNQSSNTYLYLAIAADPDQTDPTVDNSFDVVTYTGNDSSQDIETDFKPDLVWIKRRTSSEPHAIYDSIRGINKQLSSDSAGAEATNSSPYEGFTAFNDNGFTVGNNGGTNRAPNNYVAWVWKAGDHDDNLPQINTEGTIDSTVSVNDAAGFSIVKYTGNETASQTVGHGLSSSPEIAFIKQLDGGRDWTVPLFTQTSGDYLHLNARNGKQTDTNKWSAVSSTTFTVGADPYTNGTGSPYIAYLWYSVSGHSSIGTYSGSSSTVTVTTGFSPRFVIIKRIDVDGNDWIMYDQDRSSGTNMNDYLVPNDGLQEITNSAIDIDATATGFTVESGNWVGINASGGSYIYMAFK